MNKKIVSVLLLIIFVLSVSPLYAEGDVITISDKSSLLRLAEKCTLDSWSVGKTVNLTADIDFSGEEFKPIPTFSGTFNGNGHTVSGVIISKSGSNLGFFRYLEKGAVVKNLNVSGNINPNGTACYIGGIAGQNSGEILSSTYSGTVKGASAVGGIAGRCTDSGKIAYSSFVGVVVGENSVGGIAGFNDGYIESCKNSGNINTVESDKKSSSAFDTDVESAIENVKINKEKDSKTEEGIFKSFYDIGGIAGLSKGIISGCENTGAVGYQHVGYNVGGIAGRQSGLLTGCKNSGEINGRKDVGGIVGQAEPYILLNVSESTLQKVKRELETFNKMTDTLINDTDSAADNIEVYLDNISGYSETARGYAKDMLDMTDDFIDTNIDELNTYSAILSTAISDSVEVLDLVSSSADSLVYASDSLSAALSKINLYTPDIDMEIDLMTDALKTLSDGSKELKSATSYAQRALRHLSEAVTVKNPNSVRAAAKELKDAISKLLSSQSQIKKAIQALSDIISSGDIKDIDGITDALSQMLTAFSPMIDALGTMGDSLNTIISNTEVDFDEFEKAAEYLDDSLDCLNAGFKAISEACSALSDSLSGLHKKLGDYADDMTEQLNAANEELKKASDAMSYAFSDLSDAFSKLSDIAKDIADAGPMQLKKLGTEFSEKGDGLFDTLTEISDELEKMKNKFKEDRKTIRNDVQDLSDQFNLIMNLIIDSITENEEKYLNFEIEDYFVDVSESEIFNSVQGKVTKCENSGKVNADRNGGGVAGSVAIEYTSDPEDDFKRPSNLNFVYKTKAIVSECINRGEVDGKKDCMGGIAGSLSLGVIYDCEGYGNVKSESGSYVGGIAGYSESVIKRNFAKCSSDGTAYVGGVAGYTDSMSECYAIADVTGDEYTGSIAGDKKSTNVVRNCKFLDKGLGALDGISYKGKAEPATYEELSSMNVPAEFISFYVRFYADGEKVDEQLVKYGDPYGKIQMPEVPEKKGSFGKWEDIGEGTVSSDITIEAEYYNRITLLESEERNNTGKLAIALAEGEFRSDAVLRAPESKEKGPDGAVGKMKVYDIKLIGADVPEDGNYNFRIINENKDKATVWYKRDGKWEKLHTSNRGKYVKFTVDSPNVTVAVRYESALLSKCITAAVIILVLAAAAFVIIRIVKKKKK